MPLAHRSPFIGRLTPLSCAYVLALALALAPSAQADELLLDGVAAQVGSEIVLLSEVMSAAGPIEARARAAGATDADVQAIRNQALDRAVERALVRQVVRRAELDATDAEIDDAINGIATENGISTDQVRASVESQGMPYSVYRERIRGEIEHSKVMNGIVAPRVRISEDELKQRYSEELGQQPEGGTEYFIRHILVAASPERSIAKSCAEAAVGRSRIVGGEEFVRVASEISQANPQRGGTLGWIHESELAAWMSPIVLGLGDAGLSDVVEMPFGCNLVKLEDKRSYAPVSYEQAQGPLHNQMFNERIEIEYTKFIEELRSETYIERKNLFEAPGPSSPTAGSS